MENFCKNYRRAPLFSEVSEWVQPLYLGESYSHLSFLNRRFIEAVRSYLEIKTKITNSWDYELPEGKTNCLASLCAQAGGSKYVSCPAANDYIEESIISAQGIKLTWFDYTGYPEHPQIWGDFAHAVIIFDLLFNCGKNSSKYMKHVAK